MKGSDLNLKLAVALLTTVVGMGVAMITAIRWADNREIPSGQLFHVQGVVYAVKEQPHNKDPRLARLEIAVRTESGGSWTGSFIVPEHKRMPRPNRHPDVETLFELIGSTVEIRAYNARIQEMSRNGQNFIPMR